MLLPTNLPDTMVRALRSRRDSLDSLSLGASIALHCAFLGMLAMVHFAPPRPTQTRWTILHFPKDTLSEKHTLFAELPKPRGAPAPDIKVRPVPKDWLKFHRKRPQFVDRRGRGEGRAPRIAPVRTVPRPVRIAANPRPHPNIKATTLNPNVPLEKPDQETQNPDVSPMPMDPTAAPQPAEARVETPAPGQVAERAPAESEPRAASHPRPEADVPRPRPGATTGTQELGGAGGNRTTPNDLPSPMPDPKNTQDTLPGNVGVPGGESEKTVTSVPGQGPANALPGGATAGAGNGAVPGRFEVPRAASGSGGGTSPRPAADFGGGRGPGAIASAAGAGRPDLPPAPAGLRGGGSTSGDNKIAPALPEVGSGGADPRGGIRDPGPGVAIAEGGGDPSALARPRGGGPSVSTGSGLRGPAVGGSPAGRAASGAAGGAERPGGPGTVAPGGGSDATGKQPGTTGLPEFGGGGGNDGPSPAKGGEGGGLPGPSVTELPRGSAAERPGATPGTGDGTGIGPAAGTGGITLPFPGPVGLAGPEGPGGPGGLGSAKPPAKGNPGGVYVNTTGEFNVPLAVTSSDYSFNSNSVRKVIDELNGRTKLKVALGSQISLIKAESLKGSPVLVFNGHKPFRLSKQQRDALKAYVAQGGMIWADFTGDRFDDSFIEEINAIFGQEPAPIGAGHPVYRSYYLLNQVPAGDTGSRAPFEGITQDGRIIVLVTRNRYFGAVSGAPHVTEDVQEGAVQAVINIFVYAAQNYKASRE